MYSLNCMNSQLVNNKICIYDTKLLTSNRYNVSGY